MKEGDKVICIKNFKNEYSLLIYKSYYENSIYHLIEYPEDNGIFYVYDEKLVNKNNSAYPTFPLQSKFRKYFITLKEYRKLKIQKIIEIF